MKKLITIFILFITLMGYSQTHNLKINGNYLIITNIAESSTKHFQKNFVSIEDQGDYISFGFMADVKKYKFQYTDVTYDDGSTFSTQADFLTWCYANTSTIQKGSYTVFNEQLVALRTSQFNFKPTWGATTYRYKKTTTGAGATVGEINGEFRLQTGTATTNIANLETNQRGQYQAGTMGQVGVGFRIPTSPTGTQYAKWGYSDFVESGFYFGIDATGFYVAYLTGGVETKIYQSNWNRDKLNGLGTSGISLTPSIGVISQIDYTWYGYGAIDFSFLIFNTITLKTQKILAHTIKINNSASIIDPNQPLKFEVGNGASSTTDFSLYIGGHQFSIVDGNSTPQQRAVSELLTNYTTANNTLWQPIIAIRKKATFNGRPNSVNVIKQRITISADGEIETRVTSGGTTSNLTWANPTGVDPNETAIETKVTGGTALTTSVDGNPLDYGFVFSNNKSSSSFQSDVSAVLGADEELIVWIRRLSATGTIIIKHAHITVNEEW